MGSSGPNAIIWSSMRTSGQAMVHEHRPNSAFYNELPFGSESMMYTISGGDTIQPTDNLRDLGITVCSDLSRSWHSSSIACKARSIASWVTSVSRTRSTFIMWTLDRSNLEYWEYCCPPWNPNKPVGIQQLESIQRTFTSRISRVQLLNYWERLKALNLRTLQCRRERYVILQRWKILHCVSPNDIDTQFSTLPRQGIWDKTEQAQYAVPPGTLWLLIYCAKSSSVEHHPMWFDTRSRFPESQKFLTGHLSTIPDTPPVMEY